MALNLHSLYDAATEGEIEVAKPKAKCWIERPLRSATYKNAQVLVISWTRLRLYYMLP
jgi:hypothetical protein